MYKIIRQDTRLVTIQLLTRILESADDVMSQFQKQGSVSNWTQAVVVGPNGFQALRSWERAAEAASIWFAIAIPK